MRLETLPWWRQAAVAFAALALATGLGLAIELYSGAGRVGALYCAAVVVTAVYASRTAALTTALAAALLYGWMLEPRLIYKPDAEAVASAIVFALSALFVGELAGRARENAARVGRLAREQMLLEVVARENEFQDALISSVSHDFRSPLSAIIGSSANLIDYGDKLPEEARFDLLRNIHDEGERLNRMVKNILDYSRIQSGRMRLQFAPLDLAEACRTVVRRLAAVYEDRAIDTEHLHPVLARVDPVLLDSVIHNLVENSLKYGDPEGEVIVASCEEGGYALVEVVDDGPGLTHPERDLVFEKFHRLDETSGGRGTGLGLSIARGFVEAMGGTIRALPRRDGKRGLRMSVRLTLDTLA